MKKIIAVLLMTMTVSAQDGAIGTPPSPLTGVTTGSTLKWEHDLLSMSGLSKAPNGYIIYFSEDATLLGTSSEQSLAIVDPSLVVDATNASLFRYIALANPVLEGKTLHIQMLAYYTTASGRVDSDRSVVVTGMFIDKPTSPKLLTIQ